MPVSTPQKMAEGKKAPPHKWEDHLRIEFKPDGKRPGTASYIRYEEYRHAKTVAEALRLGARRSDFGWDFDRGLLKVLDEYTAGEVAPPETKAKPQSAQARQLTTPTKQMSTPTKQLSTPTKQRTPKKHKCEDAAALAPLANKALAEDVLSGVPEAAAPSRTEPPVNTAVAVASDATAVANDAPAVKRVRSLALQPLGAVKEARPHPLELASLLAGMQAHVEPPAKKLRSLSLPGMGGKLSLSRESAETSVLKASDEITQAVEAMETGPEAGEQSVGPLEEMDGSCSQAMEAVPQAATVQAAEAHATPQSLPESQALPDAARQETGMADVSPQEPADAEPGVLSDMEKPPAKLTDAEPGAKHLTDAGVSTDTACPAATFSAEVTAVAQSVTEALAEQADANAEAAADLGNPEMPELSELQAPDPTMHEK